MFIDFQLARKCSDNYSSFVYKSWYNLNENCISDNEFNKTTDYGFARAFDSFGNVFFIQLFAFDKISTGDRETSTTFNRLDWP